MSDVQKIGQITKKAYEVKEKGEWEAEIIFAKSPSEAKYKSEAYGNTDWNKIEVHRRKEFDDCTLPLNDKDYIERGWVRECGKGHALSKDMAEDALAPEGIVLIYNGKRAVCPYCHPEEYGLIVVKKKYREWEDRTYDELQKAVP